MRTLLQRAVQPIMGRVAIWQARRVMQEFRQRLTRSRDVQRRVLLETLRRNAESDFGRRYHFASVANEADFRRAVPIHTYDDLRPYIDRVYRGETSALFGPGERIHMFAVTSGTASEPKVVPVTGASLRAYRRSWMIWGLDVLTAHMPNLHGRILKTVSAIDDQRSPTGLPCGAMSGLTAMMQKRAVHNVYALPPEAACIKDTAAKYYVSLLLSLADETLAICSANPSTLLGIARALEENAEDLLRDLHDGTMRVLDGLPPAAGRAIMRRHKADPARSRQLSRVCSRRGTLRPKDVWHLPFLGCWTGGTLSLYLRQFPEFFGGAPVRDIGLIASEGRMTIPLADGTPAGVLDVESQFFEFLPARDGWRAGDRTLLAHELEPGGEYFILMTTASGLYRYDIGDIVRVASVEQGVPQVEFLQKAAHFSNLTGEKLSEHQVVEAVNAALRREGMTLTSYCLAPVWSGEAPHYALMIEADDAADRPATARLCRRVDRLLRASNIEYDGKRGSGRLRPIRALVLPDGAWQTHDRELLAQRRRGIEQYKRRFLVGDVAFAQGFRCLDEVDPSEAATAGAASARRAN